MKIIDLSCPHCGARLSLDIEGSKAICPFCDSELLLDHADSAVDHLTAENLGYSFEKGRIRAQVEMNTSYPQKPGITQPSEPRKKRHIFLWVLGWILIFPVPVTILVVRNKKLKPIVKTAFIVIAWLAYFSFAFVQGRS